MSDRWGMSIPAAVLCAAHCWLSLGCDTSVETAPATTTTSGGGSPATCSSTRGTLEGTVYRWGPPDTDFSELAPDGEAIVRQMGMDEIRIQTDDQAFFSAPLEAGDYIVTAEDPSGCISFVPLQVAVVACETLTVVVVMDGCPG